jgi:hypothetical protein
MTTGRIVAGLDPGLSGGISVIRGGKVVLAVPMPTITVPSTGNRQLRMVDGPAIEALLSPHAPDAIYIEEAYGRRGDGPGGAFTFGGCWWVAFDRVRALAPTVVILPPKRWQKDLLRPWLGMVPEWKGGADSPAGVRLSSRERNKAAAVLCVRKLHPGVDLTPGRCQNPHDGIADSVCICMWGVLHQSNGHGLANHRPRTVRRPGTNRNRRGA